MTNQVAQTILQQLGGSRFLAMTGAKYLIATERGLLFKLPAGPQMRRTRINHVAIELTPADLYCVRFSHYSARRLELRTLQEVEGVYAEDLQTLFTRVTGLDTHL